MIAVTGAAGFIGSCIVSKLNERSAQDLILIDHDEGSKAKNLEGKKYARYEEKQEFISRIRNNDISEPIECIFHMGACSSTTLQDKAHYEENNYEYTRSLAQWALKNNAKFIYASSAATYGDGSVGYKDDDATIRRCKPLNYYGESKQKFDEWVLDQGVSDQVVGLKFFNVFGPNEYHKGDMRSVACKAYRGVAQEGKISLFKSYNPDYRDGEQKRDFIYVKDAVDVCLFFMDHANINGIYNVGTGVARSWNDLARSLFAAAGRDVNIAYIDMPEVLRPRYQYFTQANMDKLREAGYSKPFTPLEEAVSDYANYLKDEACL